MKSEELAWAAGFFDGEGCTHARIRQDPGKFGSRGIAIVVAQSGPHAEVLLARFRTAVGMGGTIHKKNPRPNRQQQYEWRTSKIADVTLVIKRLWRWLGPVKRQQAVQSLVTYHMWKDNAAHL